MKISRLILLMTCFHFYLLQGESNFGYISYSTYNIGDDIQAIAAKRFLPSNSIPIDREFIGVFTSNSPIPTIVNGWYMHTKDYAWYRYDVTAPQISWPPAPSLDPLLISIHIDRGFLPLVLTKKSLKYLKKNGPVGARDHATLKALQDNQVPCYFSGCLTLTLENQFTEREEIIYAVDLEDECVEYIRSKTKCPVEILSHNVPLEIQFDNEKRLKYADEILEKYKKAKLVVTVRLHATMPCLAFNTPVLLINPREGQYRFDSLKQLVRHCTKEELLNDASGFDFELPGKNPDTYLILRKLLTVKVEQWVKEKKKSFRKNQILNNP